MTLGEKAIELAAQRLGVHEESPNWGRWIKIYLAFVGIFSPAPWCACFTAAMIYNAAAELGVKASWPKTGYVPTVVKWARKNGLMSDKPKPGMAFVVWHAELNRFAHIGFIKRIIPRKDGRLSFVTIEGNSNSTGSREGREVASNIRTWGPKYRAIEIR